MIGRTLGHYRIDAKLGEGGMGQVYKALDTRLDRAVAIKVLSPHLAQNPDLRQRFEREARVISSLNHPHICTLYDVGQEDGIDFLVMEYLEGETLAARLARGALEIDQVLRYAVQTAQALAQAHRQGVYHRDLKPGNVMLTKAGAKLLDFGLAKLVRPARPAAPDAPTLADQLTATGTILGTIQYMAPEQLEGRDAAASGDIFSFGAVLYEMITGRKAFEGRSQANVITAIMSSQPPPILTLQPAAPPALAHVVEKCLAKDPEERWQNAHDLAGELEWMAGSSAVPAVQAPATRPPRSRREILTAITASALLVALVTLGAIHFREVPEKPRAIRFHVALPENLVFRSFDFPVVSPDGERIVFSVGTSPGTPAGLWVRSLNSLTAQPLAGASGLFPFWSPDGRAVGFFSQGKLLRVDISGAPPLNLCDTGGDLGGGTWGLDGTILFGSPGGLRSVPASGGEPKPVTAVDTARGEASHTWPQFLPDGRRFLYFINGNTEVRGIYAGSLGSKDKTRLVAAEFNGVYARGHLLFLRGSALMAQPFDPAKDRLTGDPSPVADPVSRQVGTFAAAHFSASEAGILTYVEGAGIANGELVWINRDGRKLGTAGEPADYSNPALSPDGSRLAVGLRDPRTSTRDIWLLDFKRGSSSRFTFDAADDFNPAWSPDGRRIAFSSNRKGSRDLYWKASDGTGEEELLLASSLDKNVEDWSLDGKWLTFNEASRAMGALRLEPERKATPVLKGQFTQIEGRLSPNGRWIAYRSNESGRPEVYVQSFPPGSGKWQISTGGGTEPAWRRDGKELFFMADRKLMAAETRTEGSSFETGIPKALFEPPRLGTQNRNRYVATADGKRFLFVVPLDSTSSRPFVVVVNWDAGRRAGRSP